VDSEWSLVSNTKYVIRVLKYNYLLLISLKVRFLSRRLENGRKDVNERE
jgi:predicted nucleotidyltransferase